MLWTSLGTLQRPTRRLQSYTPKLLKMQTWTRTCKALFFVAWLSLHKRGHLLKLFSRTRFFNRSHHRSHAFLGHNSWADPRLTKTTLRSIHYNSSFSGSPMVVTWINYILKWAFPRRFRLWTVSRPWSDSTMTFSKHWHKVLDKCFTQMRHFQSLCQTCTRNSFNQKSRTLKNSTRHGKTWSHGALRPFLSVFKGHLVLNCILKARKRTICISFTWCSGILRSYGCTL